MRKSLTVSYLLLSPWLFLMHLKFLMNVCHFRFSFTETLMIEGGKLLFDSLEELFILQNIADLKVIKYKVFIFNFGFKISRDLTKPDGFFLFFGFTHLRL